MRPLEIADATQIQELFPHWEVVKHLNDRVPWPYPADGAHQFLRDVALPAMERGEQWSWSIRLKSDPHQLIGCISLMKGVHENRGFWLGLPWHGQGLMTEASDAVQAGWLGYPGTLGVNFIDYLIADPVIAQLIDKVTVDPNPKPYPDRFPHRHGATPGWQNPHKNAAA